MCCQPSPIILSALPRVNQTKGKRKPPVSEPVCYPPADHGHQDVAAYHEQIYFQSEDALHVAQYIPSRGSFNLKGQKVALQITGNFPMARQYIVTVSPEQDTEFCLRLRAPGWAKDAAAFINGEERSRTPGAGQWLSLRRL